MNREQEAKPSTEPLVRLAPAPGSRVLVVGGCGAVGRALVANCVALGIETAVFALQRSLQAHPPPANVATFTVDVSNAAGVAKAVSELERHWDGLDVLVFVAGF